MITCAILLCCNHFKDLPFVFDFYPGFYLSDYFSKNAVSIHVDAFVLLLDSKYRIFQCFKNNSRNKLSKDLRFLQYEI